MVLVDLKYYGYSSNVLTISFMTFHNSTNVLLINLCRNQSGNDQQEELANFGYKINMKAKF